MSHGGRIMACSPLTGSSCGRHGSTQPWEWPINGEWRRKAVDDSIGPPAIIHGAMLGVCHQPESALPGLRCWGKLRGGGLRWPCSGSMPWLDGWSRATRRSRPALSTRYKAHRLHRESSRTCNSDCESLKHWRRCSVRNSEETNPMSSCSGAATRQSTRSDILSLVALVEPPQPISRARACPPLTIPKRNLRPFDLLQALPEVDAQALPRGERRR